MRTRVHDYVDKEIEKSRQQEVATPEEGKSSAQPVGAASNGVGEVR